MNEIYLTLKINQDSPPELLAALVDIARKGNVSIEPENDLSQIKTVNRQGFISYFESTLPPDDANARQKAKTKAKSVYPELLKYFQKEADWRFKSILDVRCPNCLRSPGICRCAHMHAYYHQPPHWDPGAVWEIGIESLIRLTATDLDFMRPSNRDAILGWIEHLKVQPNS